MHVCVHVRVHTDTGAGHSLDAVQLDFCSFVCFLSQTGSETHQVGGSNWSARPR